MSIIQAAGSGEVGSSGFYKLLLDQSLKFNDADSPYLKRTPASQGSLTTFTFSFWYKRCKFGTYQEVLHVYPGSGERSQILFMNNDTLKVELEAGNTNQFLTNMVFRDPSAWYNVVVTFDSTNGTQANRVKIYVNGVDQSGAGGGGFSTANYPSQNATSGFNTTSQHEISTYDGSDYHLDGYLAEVNFIDGTALTAASFGETKDGIWTPKDTSGLTFGTNGYHLTFKDDVVSEGFNTGIWTGTGADNSISGIGFSPAFVWIKDRTDTAANYLFDVNRGALKDLYSSSNGAEYSASQTLKSFDGDGFTLGNNTGVNGSADDVVAWCWEGGGTPTATNSAGAGATPTAGSVKIDGSNLGSALAGTIPATKISANTARGFSIVGYEATGSAGTIAHGLSAAPELIIVKHRDQSGTSWPVYYGDNTDAMYLNSNGATSDDANAWNDTTPTSTVFSVGANGGDTNNSSGGSTIAYCFHSVSGYSKIGTFTGNGGSQAIDVGFEPAWVMLRRTNGGTWGIFDSLRGNSGSDRNLQMLAANSTATETTNSQMTFSGNTFNDNGYLSDNGTTVLYMAFADTREAAFFKDVSTNGNHWVPVNLDYRDSVPDTPTNNFSTMNALQVQGGSQTTPYSLSEGNLKMTSTANNYAQMSGSMGVQSGKWYTETYINSAGYPSWSIGWTSSDRLGTWTGGNDADGVTTGLGYFTGSNVLIQDFGDANNSSRSVAVSGLWSGGRAPTTGDIIGCAVDFDNRKIWWSINGEYVNIGSGAGDPANGTNPASTYTSSNAADDAYKFAWQMGYASTTKTINFGQDSSFSGVKATSNANADGNGHGSFQYAPPSGFLSLCSQNLPDAAIIDGTEYFNTVTYTGTGSSNSVTGVGFQPDWVWGKRRDSTGNHWLNDAVRGATKGLHSDSTSAEYTDATVMNAFNSDGFTVVSHAISNASSATYVAWNWLAGTAFSNSAGANGATIASSGQVNTKAGFSIVSFSCASGVTSGTVKHGLSVQPQLLIGKTRNHNVSWYVETPLLAENLTAILNETDAWYNPGYNHWNDTYPTDTVFSVGGYMAGHSDLTLPSTKIVYAFANVEGYSKVGSYVGNGSTDGTFVYTGFRPAWIMQKKSNNTGHWHIWDSTRNTSNEVTRYLSADDTSAEATDGGLDILSNGFKPRKTGSGLNASGDTYIYLAFASQPFKFSNAF